MNLQCGSYQLTGLLGRGGMGEVWLASHRYLKRSAAVKLIRSDALSGRAAGDVQKLLQRFEREVQATSLLTSPHTVRVYDYGRTRDGTFYYAMELLTGCSLDQLVAREGSLPPSRVVYLLAQACESLAEAHHNRLVHRDVKPANLLLCQQGLEYDYIKVLDFGLVLPGPAEADGATKLTAENIAVGTPAFLAPEAVLHTAEVGPQSDVYSLGCVAYWLLTGTLVFAAPTLLEMAMQHARDLPEPPSHRLGSALPAPLESLVLRCLSKDPNERPANALELLELLQASLTGKPWTQADAAAWWQHHRPERFSGTLQRPPAEAAAVVALPDEEAGKQKPNERTESDTGELHSIAVLPLSNLMADPEQQYFVLGMHESLIAELSRIGALSVICRTSVLRYQDTTQRLSAIAEELGVSAVVEGSVLRSGQSVRIGLRLVSARNERLLWGETYDGDLREVFQLQSRIAVDVAKRVKVALTPEEQRHVTRARAVDPRALDFHLRGDALASSFEAGELHRAIHLYERALLAQPDLAAAYAGIARCHNTLATFGFVAPRDAFPESVKALEHALALDPELASAHASLGYARLFFEWDFEEPRMLFRKALSLEPSSVAALCDYGRYLAVVGDAELAREVIARAVVLDPHSPVTRLWLGWVQYMARAFDEAASVFESIVETWPTFVYGHLWLAAAYAALGRVALGAASAAEVVRTPGVSEDHNLLCVLGYAFAQLGDVTSAQDVLAQLQAVPNAERFRDPAYLCCIHGMLGDSDLAIVELRRAFEHRSMLMVYMDRHPVFDPLRRDPRFLELRMRMRIGAELPDVERSSS